MARPFATDAKQCSRGENTVSLVQLPRKPRWGKSRQDLAWAGKAPCWSARLFGDENRLHLVLQPPQTRGSSSRDRWQLPGARGRGPGQKEAAS